MNSEQMGGLLKALELAVELDKHPTEDDAAKEMAHSLRGTLHDVVSDLMRNGGNYTQNVVYRNSTQRDSMMHGEARHVDQISGLL